jgi:hypothetical protein
MPITKYQNQTLVGQTFRVEECWFVNCTLKDCALFYSGGPIQLENATMQNCQWKFEGAAQQTIGVLSMIGLLPIQPTHLQQQHTPTGPVN